MEKKNGGKTERLLAYPEGAKKSYAQCVTSAESRTAQEKLSDQPGDPPRRKRPVLVRFLFPRVIYDHSSSTSVTHVGR